MDARYYNGDDDRDLGADEPYCRCCGARDTELCKPGCDCDDCLRPDAEFDERAA